MPVDWSLACKTPAINIAIECSQTQCTYAPRSDGQTGPISQSLYTRVCYTTCAGWRATPTRVLPRICYPPDLKCRRLSVCYAMAYNASKEPPAPVEPSRSAGDVSTAALQLLWSPFWQLTDCFFGFLSFLFLGLCDVAGTRIGHADGGLPLYRQRGLMHEMSLHHFVVPNEQFSTASACTSN
jgi:hypothetical protein